MQPLTHETPAEKKILLVDDCEITRMAIEESLRAIGFKGEILKAANGLEALEIIQRYRDKISAVITDYEMPKMDGFKLLSEILKSKLWRGKIAMLTGKYEVAKKRLKEMEKDLQEAGIEITASPKPLRLKTLIEFLEKAGFKINSFPASPQFLATL